ncbi:MAG: hypothetical protein LQ339_006629 [Xanthoria mediterranea]|nr:MAG: hypothetical protein LQ339_006629 [Xanthoria mediterranea]
MLPFFDFGYCLYSISLFAFVLSLPASAPASHSLSLTSNDKTSLRSQLRCDSRSGIFTRQIAHNSCADALRKIGRRADSVVFGTASLAHKDVTLPLRYLSDDGLCAFDVEMKPGANRDISSGVAVSHAAMRVWKECPLGKGYGDKATDFSRLRCHLFFQHPCLQRRSVLFHPLS